MYVCTYIYIYMYIIFQSNIYIYIYVYPHGWKYYFGPQYLLLRLAVVVTSISGGNYYLHIVA